MVLCYDDSFLIYDYCRDAYGQVIRIRRPEQLSQLVRKGNSCHGGSEKPLLLVETLTLSALNTLID